MKQFILDVIRVSHIFFSKDRVFNPEEILSNFSHHVMKGEIIAPGERVFDAVTDGLAEYKFVHVMIDAGSMLNKGYVHVTISSLYSSQKPLPFDLFIKDGPMDWTAQDYFEALEAQVARLISLHKPLIPEAICHERLLCQSLAVRRLVDVLEGNKGIVLVDCPCLNHLLNTVFAHNLNMPGFKVIVKRISALATELRKRDAVFYLKRRCPYPPKTRWLYLCDTLAFLYRHKDAIISCLLQRTDGATVKYIREEYLPVLENYKSETEQDDRNADPSMHSVIGSDDEDDPPLYDLRGCISNEDDEIPFEKGDEDSDDCWIDEIDEVRDFDTNRISDEVCQKEEEL